MLTAYAHVPTDRASRYLVQFCRHADEMSHHPGDRPRPDGEAPDHHVPPTVDDVAWSDSVGTVRYALGRTVGHCVLRATENSLLLSVDAEDEDTLQRLLDGISRRLVTIGRRDGLTVEWQHPDTAADLSPSRRRRLVGRLLLIAAATLVVIAHLGLLGGALAASIWTRWAGNIVLAVIALKVVAVGVHLLLGRLAIRRHSGSTAARRARRGHLGCARPPRARRRGRRSSRG